MKAVTNYRTLLDQAAIKDGDSLKAIERIEVTEKNNRTEVRFSYYHLTHKNNWRLTPSPLTIVEDKWCELFKTALQTTVFPGEFIEHVYAVCKNYLASLTEFVYKVEIKKDGNYDIYAKGCIEDGNSLHAVERVYSKQRNREEIRFAWYQRNQIGNWRLVAKRPLDVAETEWFDLFEVAVNQHVFNRSTAEFMMNTAGEILGI
ncbi:hypothetical protein [Bacillus cereus]|uniref:Uncharacterized protein n=1 Tax=Bacillus cereus TaxID=1396 RepID=A0A2B1KHP1_BACCE|nr:hypothetical protein [Bacillus cereus]PFN23393.1 hypothetical protein COJ50_17330 [Bacillus cereus]